MEFAQTSFNMIVLLIGALLLYYGKDVPGVAVILCSIYMEIRVVFMNNHHRKVQYLETTTELTDARTKFGAMMSTLDTERWKALGIEFPELEIVFEGKPRVILASTDLLLPCLQKFLIDSTQQEFVPEHYYNVDQTLQTNLAMSREAVRRQWWVAVKWLKDRQLLIDAPVGPHTWRWQNENTRATLLHWFVYAKPFDNSFVVDPDKQVMTSVQGVL